MVLKVITMLVFSLLTAFFVSFFESLANKKKGKKEISFKDSLEDVGFPILKFNSNGKELNFILDSGADSSIIDSNMLEGCKHNPIDFDGHYAGISGEIQEAKYANLEFNIGKNNYNHIFLVSNMDSAFAFTEEYFNIKLAGILGNDFLTKNNYVLDFATQRVYFNGKDN